MVAPTKDRGQAAGSIVAPTEDRGQAAGSIVDHTELGHRTVAGACLRHQRQRTGSTAVHVHNRVRDTIVHARYC